MLTNPITHPERYIPALSSKVMSRVPLAKYNQTKEAWFAPSEEFVNSLSEDDKLNILHACNGSDEHYNTAQIIFNARADSKMKHRPFFTCYVLLFLSQEMQYPISFKGVSKVYRKVWGARLQTDNTLIVANYENFYLIPPELTEVITEKKTVEVTPLNEKHVNKVLELFGVYSKKAKEASLKEREASTIQMELPLNIETPIEKTDAMTLEEYDETNKNNDVMECVFDFALKQNLIKDLMSELANSDVSTDLTRSTEFFLERDLAYTLFVHLRNNGYSV